jgi:hypothetical protein
LSTDYSRSIGGGETDAHISGLMKKHFFAVKSMDYLVFNSGVQMASAIALYGM